MKFKDYLRKIEEQNVPGAYDGPVGGYELPSHSVRGLFDNIPSTHPTNDTGVPVVRRESRIRILDERGLLSKVKTPVFIQLEDGTRLYMTRHEFERIKGDKPAVGKTLTVTFQRNLVDKSDQYSQIDSVYCR